MRIDNMRFIFIRHGETDYNKMRKHQGQDIDAPLNEAGLRQAKETAKNLSSNFDIIISSSLKRSLRTAEIISEYFKKGLVIDDRIKEKSWGKLAGLTDKEIEKITDGKVLKEQAINQTYDYRPYGGESAEDVKKRFLEFIKETKKKYKGKTILVVAHGGIIRMAHHLFSKEEVPIIVGNVSVHEFDL